MKVESIMKKWIQWRISWETAWIAAAVVVLLTSAGCAVRDAQNASAQPWSSPRDWEHGLPSGITEGR